MALVSSAKPPKLPSPPNLLLLGSVFKRDTSREVLLIADWLQEYPWQKHQSSTFHHNQQPRLHVAAISCSHMHPPMHCKLPLARLCLLLFAACGVAANVARGHSAALGLNPRKHGLHRSLSTLTSMRGGASSHQSGEMLGAHQPVSQPPPSLVKQVDGNYNMRQKFEHLCRTAQASICKQLEELDGGATFRTDSWVRPDGGGGISRVLAKGKVFEKAGVNLSVVYGSMPKEALKAATERGVNRAGNLPPGAKVPFFACGISSVIHPRNPFCPTMHFNYRYFETDGGIWWFGGGSDITPAYLDEEDIRHFHQTYKNACDKHDPEYYPYFKKWADEYFHIKHRGETRGLGGIFYDDQNEKNPDEYYALASSCLDAVMPAYAPIIQKHKNDRFTPSHKDWQLIRRGRYTEFNLVYDRGTTFGLKTGGRTESILMSLPEMAKWEYDHHPIPGSEEDKILKLFQKPRDWV